MKESQAAKMESEAQDTTTVTEVFDSSKYDSMAETKKSADMRDEPAIAEVQTSNVNVNPSHITDIGKANLLPIDVVLGWKFTNSKP